MSDRTRYIVGAVLCVVLFTAVMVVWGNLAHWILETFSYWLSIPIVAVILFGYWLSDRRSAREEHHHQ